ncbi:hypothetical protein [Thalassotalea litorea]|uniref:hypothetical protein n=1 Tax=Thalassotalea litorea TaxID=2020715 RepID=UPI0037364948
MSQQEIYQIAHQLNIQGKTPTVALIKSQLSVAMPLTAIIKGLQQWQRNPKLGETSQPQETAGSALADSQDDSALHLAQQAQQQIQNLQQKLQAMAVEITQLKQEVEALKSER